MAKKTKKKVTKTAPAPQPVDPTVTPTDVRAARELLERAAEAFARVLVDTTRMSQADLAVALEFGRVADTAKAFSEVFASSARGLRERVEARARALAADPLASYPDEPVEPGLFCLSFKENKGKRSVAWKDEAQVQWRRAEGLPLHPSEGDEDPAAVWAQSLLDAQIPGPSSYTPKVEVRG